VPDGAGLQIIGMDVVLGGAGEYVQSNFVLQLIIQHAHKQRASKVGHRMDRGSAEALQKKGKEKRGKSWKSHNAWDGTKLDQTHTVSFSLSARGEGLSASPTIVQESHAYDQLLKKAGRNSEGTKQAIRAEGLITETQKYPLESWPYLLQISFSSQFEAITPACCYM